MKTGPLIAAGLLLSLAVGCTTGAPPDDAAADTGVADEITVWTVEDVQDRITATEKIIAGFTEKSGVKVKLVAISEAQFDKVVTTSAAGGTLPDVVAALSPAGVQSMAVSGLLDTKATGEVVDSLGRDTFSPAALELTRDGEEQTAVPSDAWTQLLYYRKDLFAAAGLEAPDTYEKIEAAAKKLTEGGTSGIALSTKAGEPFTHQSFEHLALGNGCEMVDGKGTVTLDSMACEESFAFYGDLARSYSADGNQDVDTTRANYFSGKAAMVIWSTFLLDELAGLRDDALPTCPECKDDPGFLAKNTGVVGPVSGPSGNPAQYGRVTSWALTKAGNAAASKQFVEYMMDEAYPDWLAVAPEGKVPVRKGTARDPQKFVKAWGGLEAGVDRKAPLTDFYPADVIETLITGPDEVAPWGFSQGQGALVGATNGRLPVAEAVNDMVNGTAPKKAARQADAAVTEIAESLK
ncbi:ABC transporter substrate-binding protein [Streptomyces sp. NPDC056568]|uniref:ABC transporter substrate-binding protein n=1 Tax=Streptomyces sp. NPDC056568 TaxID=3345866 RepID=UPI0036CFC92C